LLGFVCRLLLYSLDLLFGLLGKLLQHVALEKVVVDLAEGVNLLEGRNRCRGLANIQPMKFETAAEVVSPKFHELAHGLFRAPEINIFGNFSPVDAPLMFIFLLCSHRHNKLAFFLLV